MPYDKILQGLMPMNALTQNQGVMSDPRMQQAFNVAAQGQQYRNMLDQNLAKDVGQMRTGAAMQMASPLAGLVPGVGGALAGGMYGAGNALMNQTSGGQAVGQAALGAAGGAAAQKLVGAAQSALANRAGAMNATHPLSQQVANNFNNTTGGRFGQASAPTVGQTMDSTISQRIPYNTQPVNTTPINAQPTFQPPAVQQGTSLIPQQPMGGNMMQTIPQGRAAFTPDYAGSIGVPNSPSFGGQFGAIDQGAGNMGGAFQSLLNAEGGGAMPMGMSNMSSGAMGAFSDAGMASASNMGQQVMRNW